MLGLLKVNYQKRPQIVKHFLCQQLLEIKGFCKAIQAENGDNFPILAKTDLICKKIPTTHPAHTFIVVRMQVLHQNHKLHVLRVYNMFLLSHRKSNVNCRKFPSCLLPDEMLGRGKIIKLERSAKS